MSKNDKDKFLSYYKETKFLKYQQFWLERDLIRVANGIFEQEKELKKSGQLNSFTIKISEETYNKIDVKQLIYILEEVFLLILLEKVKIRIKPFDDNPKRKTKKIIFNQTKAVVLFSGGLDSFSGITRIEKTFGTIEGVFVAHNDQHRIISIVNKMKSKIKSNIRTLYASGMGSTGYSQIRGFLYVLFAGVYASLCKSSNIFVTECGPTMYQPLFSPFDSITYTTHPYILKAASDVVDILTNKKINILIPYEDMTKAELIIDSKLKDYSDTHSCISQRFGDHDGTCFGCVVRRLSCLVSGVKDVNYNTDMFSPKANQDNLLCLLDYSKNILTNYEQMPAFQTDKINEFGKRKLFERYALDNIAGLMLGTSKTHTLYKRYVIGNEKVLKQRIKIVRAGTKKPDFSHKV